MPGAIPPTGVGATKSFGGPSPQDPQQIAVDIANMAMDITFVQSELAEGKIGKVDAMRQMIADRERMQGDLDVLNNQKGQLPPNAQQTLSDLSNAVNLLLQEAPDQMNPNYLIGVAYTAGTLAGELEKK